MIRIDHLSFDFVMDDERFAQGLYADWDSFCRTCVENVLEDCLSDYDRDRVLHVIEKMDLDLGSMPQENFYTEFPRKLREALLKALPSLQFAQKEDAVTLASASRFANLLFYLEHGTLRTEWADIDFDLATELDEVMKQDKRYMEKIAGLCMANEYVLRRLLLQTDPNNPLVRLYSIAMDRMFSVKDGKRRFMELFLEMQPDVPLRFVHETEEEERLHGMAELLGARSVYKIMEKETGEHAEVDIPPYWHYLYEWLIKYYPYNGVAIFGGKSDFIAHLHYRLLTFIRKRNYTFYLSKTELTASFLLEVFGAVYYKDVLNAIYRMQERNADGSPAYDGYYNIQLYRVFMQLSLLVMPGDPDGHQDRDKGESEVTEYGTLLKDFKTEDLNFFLKDTRRDKEVKRRILSFLVRQKPEEIVAWLRDVAVMDKPLMAVLTELTDHKILFHLLISVSFESLKTVDAVVKLLKSHATNNSLLQGFSSSQLDLALRKAVMRWIADADNRLSDKREMFKELLLLVLVEATGKNKEEIERQELMTLLYHIPDISLNVDIKTDYLLQTDWTLLASMIKDSARQDTDKRMLLRSIILRGPEAFVVWLKTVANDFLLINLLAALIDGHLLRQLLAANSLEAMVCVEEVVRYLATLTDEHKLPYGWTGLDSSVNLRKVVLVWIGENGSVLSDRKGVQSLLMLIHKEMTDTVSMKDMPTADKWIEEFYLLDNNKDEYVDVFNSQEDKPFAEKLTRLYKLLTAHTVSEAIKRRLIAALLERYRDNTTDVIRTLHEQGLLDSVVNYIDGSVVMVIIRRMIQTTIHAEQADKFISMIERLFMCENTAGTYLSNKSVSLKEQVLVWIAMAVEKQIQLHAQTSQSSTELFSLLLISLFSKENVSIVVKLMRHELTGDMKLDILPSADALEVVELLSLSEHVPIRYFISALGQWSAHVKEQSNTIQTWLQSLWNTPHGFTSWLEDSGIPTSSKRELLQTLAGQQPQELVAILRRQPRNDDRISLMSSYLSTEALLDGLAKVDSRQAYLLSRTFDWLQREQGRFAFLSTMNKSFSSVLSQALLLFMQDEATLGNSNLTQEALVGKFLAYLYFVYTRKTDFQEHIEWNQLHEEMANGLELSGVRFLEDTVALSEEGLLEKLRTGYGQFSDSQLYLFVSRILEFYPEAVIKLAEQPNDAALVGRLTVITDKMMLGRMVKALSRVSGFENSTVFVQLIEWLISRSADDTSLTDVIRILFSWLSTTDWRRQSQEQMMTFFSYHLYGFSNSDMHSLEILTEELPQGVRKDLLRLYMRSRPLDLLKFMREQFAKDASNLAKWIQETNLSEWLQVAENVSLTLGELLKQVIEYLLSPNKWMYNETELKRSLILYLTSIDTASFTYHVEKKEVIRSFVLSLPEMQGKSESEKEETVQLVISELGITDREEEIMEDTEDDTEILLVGNAGLCLLSPWFPRLFFMLGYINEGKRDFKDTISRLRAVFVIQYLANPEDKDYRESELTFNRLLVSLPAQIPLPKRMELTEEEKRTAGSMLEGVKANWDKMKGTSIDGFRRTFLIRNGQLEQQDERWLLTVEDKAYDILLDTIPWGFRQIRFPWMKKYIQVSWHEKQEF